MFKKSTIIKGLILLLVVGVLAGVGLGMGGKVGKKNESEINSKVKNEPAEIYFYLSEKPLLNKEVRLVTTVIPNRDIGTTSVEVNLPEGITLVGTQSLSWQGDMKEGELIQIPVEIKMTKAGKWNIEANVKSKEILKKGSLTIETTNEEATLSSNKAEHILNPLPKDKFVFIRLVVI